MNLSKVAQRIIPPNTILDIGANRGHWAQEAAKVWPCALIECVEANPECFEHLAQTQFAFHIAVLSDADKEVTFYQRKGAPACTGCSYYRELTEFYEGEKAQPTHMQAVRLDRLLPNKTFDLIKLDVQGAELDVLRGGPGVVSRAQALLMECALEPYNDGAPLVDEVIDFCASIGFGAAEPLDDIVHPTKRHVIQRDYLFLRS
jgi:FkbM family methyltransferase